MESTASRSASKRLQEIRRKLEATKRNTENMILVTLPKPVPDVYWEVTDDTLPDDGHRYSVAPPKEQLYRVHVPRDQPKLTAVEQARVLAEKRGVAVGEVHQAFMARHYWVVDFHREA